MAIRIRRRDFVVALVGAAAARPLAASAERPTAPVIGWLSPGSPETDVLRLSAFNQGLNEISQISTLAPTAFRALDQLKRAANYIAIIRARMPGGWRWKRRCPASKFST